MIYFDNAATTWQKPDGVMHALHTALHECGGNPGRAAHRLSLSASEAVDAVRVSLAALLSVPDPGRIVFCKNATEALNLAIYTRVQRGDHVLISDREHNAVYRPICRLVRQGIIDFDVFRIDENTEENIQALLRENTRVLVCNHISNVDGKKAPLEAIGHLCRKHGIYFIVDASQSLGHCPVLVNEIGADALCGPGHKGLFGIQGCGFAYLRQERGLREFLSGGSGSASRLPFMPTALPERFEAGTLPTPAILTLGAGVDFVRQVTPCVIADHEKQLTARLRRNLEGQADLHLYGGEGGLLSLTAQGHTPDELAAALDERGVCVRAGLHCAPLAHSALGTAAEGTLRISFSYFNTESEVDAFSDILLSLLKVGRSQ